MGAKEHPSEALVCPRRRPRVRAAPALWGVCSCREGFVTMGVSSSHPCCAVPQTLQRIPSILILVSLPHYPQNCLREPGGRHMLPTGLAGSPAALTWALSPPGERQKPML